MAPVAGYGVVWFSDRANRRGCVEWRCALRAKSGLGSVFGSALGAPLAERRRTLVAKPRARSIIGSAVRAAHRLPRKPSELALLVSPGPGKGQRAAERRLITSCCPSQSR